MEPQIDNKPQAEQVNPTVTQTTLVQNTCKYCKNIIAQDVFFCSICGKKLKDPPLSTTIGKQLGIYAISLLLPPLGLMPGIKYLLSKEKHARLIGAIAIILTSVSVVVSIIYAVILSNRISDQINYLLTGGL